MLQLSPNVKHMETSRQFQYCALKQDPCLIMQNYCIFKVKENTSRLYTVVVDSEMLRIGEMVRKITLTRWCSLHIECGEGPNTNK